jgi:hypothetical protein
MSRAANGEMKLQVGPGAASAPRGARAALPPLSFASFAELDNWLEVRE